MGVNELSNESLGGVSGGNGLVNPVAKTGDYFVVGPNFRQRCESKPAAESLAAKKTEETGKVYSVEFICF